MFRKIGLKIRSKRLAKAYRQPNEMVGFDRASKIGILIPDLEKNKEVISKLIQTLKKEGKEVQVLTYHSGKKELSVKFDHGAISKKDLSWMGKVKSYNVKKFIKTDFDYLFSLNTSPFLPFESILATSNAKCRVGMYHERKKNYFDLMIHADKKKGLGDLAEQMIFYTKKIN